MDRVQAPVLFYIQNYSVRSYNLFSASLKIVQSTAKNRWNLIDQLAYLVGKCFDL